MMDIWVVSSIVNKAALNICVKIFVWTYAFLSFGYVSRSGIAGTYDNFV